MRASAIFDSILKADKLEGLHFIMCLCAMTCWNVIAHKKCWLCEDVNLVLLWISRLLGTRWQCLTVFSLINIEKNKCRKVDFLQIKHFFRDELGKASSESWHYRGLPAPLISLISIHSRWTAMWFVTVPEMNLLKLSCRR